MKFITIFLLVLILGLTWVHTSPYNDGLVRRQDKPKDSPEPEPKPKPKPEEKPKPDDKPKEEPKKQEPKDDKPKDEKEKDEKPNDDKKNDNKDKPKEDNDKKDVAKDDKKDDKKSDKKDDKKPKEEEEEESYPLPDAKDEVILYPIEPIGDDSYNSGDTLHIKWYYKKTSSKDNDIGKGFIFGNYENIQIQFMTGSNEQQIVIQNVTNVKIPAVKADHVLPKLRYKGYVYFYRFIIKPKNPKKHENYVGWTTRFDIYNGDKGVFMEIPVETMTTKTFDPTKASVTTFINESSATKSITTLTSFVATFGLAFALIM